MGNGTEIFRPFKGTTGKCDSCIRFRDQWRIKWKRTRNMALYRGHRAYLQMLKGEWGSAYMNSSRPLYRECAVGFSGLGRGSLV